MTIRRFILATTAAVLAGAPAGAQGFDRDRNESVRERAIERGRGDPVRAGAFNLWPQLRLGVLFNDNIRAVGSGKESDFILSLNPELVAQSDWTRHQATLSAFLNSRNYMDNDEESHTDWGGDGELRLDFAGPLTARINAGYASLHEVRTSPSSPFAAREPVPFDSASIGASLSRVFNRLRVSGGAGVNWLDFDDVFSLGGILLDQDFRDRQVVDYFVRLDYAVSPSTALFASARGNQRDYDVGGILARDSDGYEVNFGADFDIGALARGELSVGYVDQDYDSPLFAGVEGFGVNANVEYFATPLTTVTFSGRVAAEETSVAAATGYLEQSVGLRIDHELFRTVILNGRVTYSRDDYEGIDRLDNRWGTGVGAIYMMNRNVGLSGEYTFFRQDSSGAGGFPDYSVNVLSFSVILRPS